VIRSGPENRPQDPNQGEETVRKVGGIIGVAFAVLLLAGPVMAADGGTTIPGAIGAGLVTIGGAYGIGRLAGSALEGMARQPEVAGSIQTAMIIAAALIEGFTFYALYICSQMVPPGWTAG
jgi:F-type H+-transporting ATPase subunit c